MKLFYVLIYLSLRCYRICTQFSHKIHLKKKIKELIKANGLEKLSNGQIAEINLFYGKYGINGVSHLWHRYYAKSNSIFSPEYIPESVFYLQIEKKINMESHIAAMEDKNLLSRLLSTTKQPVTILKNMNGCFYVGDELVDVDKAIEVCDKNEKMVIKPTIETGGGKNVILFTCSKGITSQKNLTIEDLLKSYQKNYIVQEAVSQHPLMAQLNPTSLNTLRIMTYMPNCSEVMILSTIARFGLKGSFVDNATLGGLTCGVQVDGRLNNVGFQNLTGAKYEATDSGIPFENITLPFMEKIKSSLDRMHKLVPYFKLISWDLAIDTDENVVLIEFNATGQDLNMHQLNNGPILGILLNELI